MIKKLKIHALKSIKDLELSCSNLNLFVGTNSSGKSTCLQALLLFEQNHGFEGGLNGAYVSLGEFREIRNSYMPREEIRIELEGVDANGIEAYPEWISFAEEEDSYSIDSNIEEIVKDYVQNKNGTKAVEKYEDFHYLSCHRIGAEDIYHKNLAHYSTFGINGEFALDYLLNHGSDFVEDALRVKVRNAAGEEVPDENVSGDLLSQVNYWLKYIIGTELSVREIQKTNCLQVTYNNNPANSASDALYRRPVNIGSGVSYLISIIITCLGSEKNAVIVLENPEIHLHPKAQSRLCELLYFTAISGRQLFVETHSDHIFNGLRVGISSKNWDQEKVCVNFLAVNEQYETMCNPIGFGPLGKIYGKNPKMDLNDLFDQFEIDLDRMLGM